MRTYFKLLVIFLVLSCWVPQIAPAQVVNIPDANLEAALRELFETHNVLEPNQPITRQHMELILSLNLSGENIKDLRGLEYATGLVGVNLSGNQISNLSPLAGLTQLEELRFQLNGISNLSPLARLTQLRVLDLGFNKISDLRPLAGLRQLERLELWANSISDVRPLARLTQLERLNLVGNKISDLRPLAGLRQLVFLFLSGNEISDLRPLVRLTELVDLQLESNKIQDVRPLAGLRQLVVLNLVGNQITDVRPLAGLVNLEQLFLTENPITDTSPLAKLTKLTNVDVRITTTPPPRPTVPTTPVPSGVIPDSNLAAAVRNALGLARNARITQQAMRKLTTLKAPNRQITDLTGLEHATQLVDLNLGNNQIRDVSPLAKLTQLETLDLAGNQIRDVSPLAGLTRLKRLSIFRNQISNVSPLAGLVNLNALYLRENPIQDTSPLASLTKLTNVDVEILQPAIDFTLAGPKIEGPWAWTIVSTGRIGGAAAAASEVDYLKRASKGSLTETQIATNGAVPGDTIGNKVWTSGKLSSTGRNNITEMLNDIGLRGNRENHVAYGSISLDTPRRQNTTMYVGSDDAVKVWLNGVLVHNNPIDRGAIDYQDAFPVTLKKGKNILLVAVYERTVDWSGFFGFKRGTAYSLVTTPVVQVGPAQRPPMYWIDSETGALHRLVDTEVETFIPDVQKATSLAVDATNNKIYWTEQMNKNRGKIKRANLDGSNVQVLATPFGVPRSIAVDTLQGMLYWTDSGGRIQRSNLNGRQLKNLARNLDSPDNITIDVAGAKLYWTEAPGNIRRADLNGKGIEDIARGLSPIGDIAISGNKIYWTEITDGNRGKIGRANLNGSNARTLATPLNGAFNIAIDAVDKKLYWTDSLGNIRRANLVGRSIKNVVSNLPSLADFALGSLGRMTAAAPMNSSSPPTPDTTGLLANYPNPFNPETWIPYQLATPADVRITIYAVDGQMVRRLELGHQAAGVYQSRSRAAYWDGRNAFGEPVASGVYFYTLSTESTRDSVTAGNFTATRKMLIRK